jgi:hypothetical protein
MEKVYDLEMINKYDITELNEMYKGVPTEYKFGNSQIDVFHVLNGKSYIDPWDYPVYIGDVYISINYETVEVLKDYPVREGEEGINQYNHYVSYWKVEDERTDKKSFVIVLQMNGAKEKQLPNGDIVGGVPIEELEYLSITVREDGTVAKDSFTYKDKNKLQTKLIPPMNFGGAGYYTDAWLGWPTFIFPWLYPFLTIILGLLLILTNISYKSIFMKAKS